ncbi:MAG: PQQ-binding-like beta-propeller repeat protein [Chloroflexi bacterium]|nr:PQQ-binding-like beta-propeller repeat protein [Chloroflexota bacterium]
MSSIDVGSPLGVLGRGWSAMVGDYAMAGGWSRGGEALVVGDAEGGVYAFDGESGETAWERRGVHDGGVLSVAVHPDGSVFATAGQDGRVLIWDAAEGQVTRAIEVGSGWVENVAWSKDGQRLAASSSRRVHAYDKDGEEVWQSDSHPSTVSAIAWSRRGELATACYSRVTFLGAATGKARQTLEWQGSLVSMVLSPDGDIVACGSQDNSVHFWRRSTGQDSEMWGYPAKPSALAFDDSGTVLATGGGEAVTVWSFRKKGPEGTRPGVLEFHEQPVSTLAFAPGAMRLASGGRDGAVVVWMLKVNGRGRPVGAEDLGAPVAQLYWRPDGRALAALDARGGVTVWSIEQAEGRIRLSRQARGEVGTGARRSP